MSEKKSSVVSNGIWSIVGTFLIKAVNLISIPIFSRLMSTAEYGDSNLFLTYASIFMVLVSLDFSGTMGKGLLRYEDDRWGFISVGSFTVSAVTAVFLLIINVFCKPIGRLMSMDRVGLNLLVFYSFALAIITFANQNFLFYFKYKKNTILSLTVAVLNLGVSVILICTAFSEKRVMGRILGAAIPTIIIALGIYVYFLYRGRKLFNKEYLKHYAYGIPLIPHSLSHFILGNADRIMIQNMISSSANGIYSLVYNIGLMISVLIEALNNVWNPWMFRKLDQDDTKTLRKAYSIYAFAFSAVTIVVAAVSPEVVKIVAPRDYWDGINFVLWVVFSAYMIFIYQLYVNIEFYEMKTYLISIGTVMAAAINIVLNLLFLKRFGYGFAAVSTLISYVALAIFHMIVCDFVIKRRIINDAHIWLMVTVTFGVTCILQSLREQMLVRWLAAVVIMAVLAAFCYRDYKKDDGILKQFKRK